MGYCVYGLIIPFLILNGAVTSAGSYPGISNVQFRIQQAERNIKQQSIGREKMKPVLYQQIQLDIETPISEVDPQFLSVTIGAGNIRTNWSGIHFSSPPIINMAHGLAPAMLRVGGDEKDFLVFKLSTDEGSCN